MTGTYNKDGRLPVEKLYRAFCKLEDYGWGKDLIYNQPDPILCFQTPQKGESLWIISGIHGEEPAGPNAIASNIRVFKNLGEKGVPVVLLPLCNPKGYRRDWRYPNARRSEKRGKSVGDSEHFLLDYKKPNSPRKNKPVSWESWALTSYVLRVAKTSPPKLVINFHEDEDPTGKPLYIYSQGRKGAKDPVAQAIVEELRRNDVHLQEKGRTEEGKPIIHGIAEKVRDGSIDELLSAEKIYFLGKIVKVPSSKSVVVVEIPSFGCPLKKRVAIYGKILASLEKFWQMVL